MPVLKLAGRRSTGAGGTDAYVVNCQAGDHSLCPPALRALTLQKYVVAIDNAAGGEYEVEVTLVSA